ncbi:MAG: 3-hydroxyacyl-CoA dehydrogenase/enoyl-CoA hydratase family protein [Gammaproteobacteria bacterium]|nr:3-hydroxyacyl-CoA dehydrogenase/enoyl-CoA hydratase family protein [Gammaproteobacteria bacterium]
MEQIKLLNPLIRTPEHSFPKAIAVIGAGTIGPDIGYYLVSSIPELSLTLVDVSQESLGRAEKRIQAYVKKGLDRGKLTPAQADWVSNNITYTVDYEAIVNCEWVLEAVTENVELKRKIFSQIESIVSPETIITSNTSSLPASLIFSDLEHKQRAAITHFFAPAFSNPAVEVVGGTTTDAAVLERLHWIFCATGKIPMSTDDVLCFMLDRVFDNWCNEAGYLLDENVSAMEVDSVATEFVHAGPFCVLNIANGNPIIIETNSFQAQEEGEHYRPASIFSSVDKWKTLEPGQSIPVDAEPAANIRDRLLGVLFSQSVDIIDRGIASSIDLELGCRIALGFKQGPFALMQDVGVDEVNRILSKFLKDRPGMPMPAKPIGDYLDFYRHILVDDMAGVKVISIRRPDALNALHDEMTDEILAVIKQYEDDPAVKGFVLTGYGMRAFCAGADIGRFPTMLGQPQAAAQYARDCSNLLRYLDGMSKPVVAALNGMALGGGFELAMRCHDIVAMKDAWLQLPEITLGIVPGIGAMVVPYRRWPHAALVLHDMLRKATKLKSAEAFELGIFTTVSDSYEEMIAAAIERVNQLSSGFTKTSDEPVDIAAMPPIDPVAASGQTLSAEVIGILEETVASAAVASSLSDALETGYQAFGKSACTAAAKEGISAFQERRRADFSATG